MRVRYPVMNIRRRMGATAGASSPSYGTLCQFGKGFQQAIDSNFGKDNQDAAAQAFNTAFDNAMNNGEDPLDLMEAVEKDCGVPNAYLKNIRPRLLTNPFTNEYFGPASMKPPGTHVGPTPTPGVHNPYQPVRPPKPPATPVATGGGKGLTPQELEEARTAWPKGEAPEPPPPPPKPPATPAPVATGATGCWYVMGQGYSWGPRPSGGESTGLSQSDCNNIASVDRQVRGLPPLQTPTAQNLQPSTTTPTATMTPSTAPPAPPKPPPAPVATGGPGACGPGQFWDGTKCRGSVSMPGGMANVPGGMTASGGAAAGLMPPPGLTDISAGSLLGQVRLVMGHRFPLLAGPNRLGMIPLVGIGKPGSRPMPSGIGLGPEPKRPDRVGQGFVLPSKADAKPLDTSVSMWSVLGVAGAVGVAVYLVLR
jgi:hypothetical protein